MTSSDAVDIGMNVKYFEWSHFFSEIVDTLQSSVQGSIEARADILWVGFLDVSE